MLKTLTNFVNVKRNSNSLSAICQIPSSQKKTRRSGFVMPL